MEKLFSTTRVVAFAIGALFLCSTSSLNAVNFGTYHTHQVASSGNQPVVSTNCGPAGVSTIVAAVGVSVAMVSAAYDFGTWVGSHLAGGEAFMLQNIDFRQHEPTNFRSFDI